MTAEKTCVGILSASGRDGIVRTDYPEPEVGRRDVFIPWKNLNGAPFGMRVVCRVDNPDSSEWRGAVIEVLGDPARPDVAIAGILRHYGYTGHFPEDVTAEAARFSADPDPAEVERLIRAGRRDLRTLTTITMDGEDAKDLDDAISIEHRPDKGYRLWVHIADVAQYVTDGSALDREARRRGTSVYLVDRVIPMLPPRLSNGICSLNPGRDRLALTVAMDIDATGLTVGGEIFESVIRSDARTSYTEIHDFLEKGAHRDRYGSMEPEFFAMRDLAETLRTRMRQRGTLEFEFPETVVDLDAEGHPVDIHPYPISFSNGIIEAFMIACNEYVAHRFHMLKVPFVYRVHELPDPDKLRRFVRLASNLGVRLRIKGTVRPGDLAAALERIKQMEYGQALSQLLLRSLAKARYAPECLGHFGLASEFYCHFTSPIRRYPDLFIHRVIKGYLTGHMETAVWRAQVGQVSENSSVTERMADQAERDTIQQKACEYMAARLGEEFEGVISGIIASGFFVRLPSTVEGMVPFRSMDDYYEFSEETLTARGTRGGRILRIGDPVCVRAVRSDTINRKIDFELAGEKTPVPHRTPGAQTVNGRKPAAGRKASSGRPKTAGRPKSGGKKRKGRPGKPA